MKTTRRFFFGVVAALATVVAAYAASPAGNWSFNSNGSTFNGQSSLSLTVDTAGNVHGTALGDPIVGFWNDSAAKLTFYRVTGGGSLISAQPDRIQIYTGYMHPCSVSSPGQQCLEGSFEAIAGAAGTASKSVYGWFAFRSTPLYNP
jgi:hypothetical protein